MTSLLAALVRATVAVTALTASACDSPNVETDGIRLATYNVSLSENAERNLASKLLEGSEKASKVAAVIQTIRPDILVLNEFDYDEELTALTLFNNRYLAKGQLGAASIEYRFLYAAPVNTGVPSALDLDNDGRLGEPEDAFGFGRYPGQYGMALLSRFPLDQDQIRTFQFFLWSSMPDPDLPRDESTGAPYYSDAVTAQFRLSSKSHWDIPVRVGNQTLHALLAHPTPPAFDGEEDRNGRRNFAEIRFLRDYVEGRSYMTDDQGRSGGLSQNALFFAAGDFNADRKDGGSRPGAINQLLLSERVAQYAAPRSQGGVEAADRQAQANLSHEGDPAEDTGDFSDARVGNLRIDYVLPGAGIKVRDSGVFWPTSDDPRSAWVTASDHRMVWVDVVLPRK